MLINLEVEGKVDDACFDFTIQQDQHVIPGTFWRTDRPGDSAPPLTLLQHGGPLHKRHPRTEELARSIVAATHGAVLLIDGPIHGRRRSEHPGLMEMLAIFKQFWQDDAGIDGFVREWQMALDAVLERGWADPDRVAWFGVSMGTAYGIPVCAADKRIKAATFGMWGTDWGQEERLLDACRQVRTPVLFQIKTEDELFPVAGQRRLFDALGSPHKCLRTHQGGHSLDAPGQLDEALQFVNRAVG
jgi:hypothetical protein